MIGQGRVALIILPAGITPSSRMIGKGGGAAFHATHLIVTLPGSGVVDHVGIRAHKVHDLAIAAGGAVPAHGRKIHVVQ